MPFVIGAVSVAGVATGRAGLFVRPWFVPVVATTGVVLLVIGTLPRSRLASATAAILLLPVIVGASLSPAVVGRISSGRIDPAGVSRRLGDGANPLLQGRGGAVTLLDIYLAEQQVGGVILAGTAVTVEGTVSGREEISRLVMVCCAADARAVTLPVVGAVLPPRGTWVRISGPLQTRGDRLVLQASRVDRVATPEQPIL